MPNEIAINSNIVKNHHNNSMNNSSMNMLISNIQHDDSSLIQNNKESNEKIGEISKFNLPINNNTIFNNKEKKEIGNKEIMKGINENNSSTKDKVKKFMSSIDL